VAATIMVLTSVAFVKEPPPRQQPRYLLPDVYYYNGCHQSMSQQQQQQQQQCFSSLPPVPSTTRVFNNIVGGRRRPVEYKQVDFWRDPKGPYGSSCAQLSPQPPSVFFKTKAITVQPPAKLKDCWNCSLSLAFKELKVVVVFSTIIRLGQQVDINEKQR
jgi:hypothetical protein